MKKTLFSILFYASVLGLMSGNVYAQETAQPELTANQKYKNSIGLAAGLTTGTGLSYRRYINRFAAQITFAPYKKDNSSNVITDKEFALHTGLTFFFNIADGSIANFFVYESNYFYYKEKVYKRPSGVYPNYMEIIEGKEVTQYTNIGLGLGVEFILERRVGLNLMAGYGAFEDFKSIGVTGEIGLYFKL